MADTSSDDSTVFLRSPMSEVEIWPALGGALVAFRARVNDRWIDITQPVSDASRVLRNSSWLGSFVMVPFANRIAGGRFAYEGRQVVLPINRPEHQAAIHGFSRGRVWSVREYSETSLILTDAFHEPGIAYAYNATLAYVLTGAALRIELTVTNNGGQAMPFGLGHHPWFNRTPKTQVRLDAMGWFKKDPRTLPVARIENPDETGRIQMTPARRMGLDRHYYGWRRKATIIWPEAGAGMHLTASPVLGNLHLFVPQDRPAICLEPVSHVPDVVNRRRYAPYGDMTTLAPGESLTGAMTFNPFGLSSISDDSL